LSSAIFSKYLIAALILAARRLFSANSLRASLMASDQLPALFPEFSEDLLLTKREDVLDSLTAMDTDSSFKHALEAAREKLSGLLRGRDEINKEIANLENAIDSLEVLCGEAPEELHFPKASEAFAENLRDAIRLVFNMARPNALTPTEVRDKLQEMGFHLDRYKYELPPIHNTIARLEAASEIELAPKLGGEKAYKFVGVLKREMKRKEKMRVSFGDPPTREEVLGRKGKLSDMG
jgi:hypothetical protein